MRLNLLADRIESAFGETPPFTSGELREADQEVLLRVFGDAGYQLYLQDQVNRQIIRDYLTNAVVLGIVPESIVDGLDGMLGDHEVRASLSLHMLMSSVEQAAELFAGGGPALLEQLLPGSDSPPHMHLIRS